MSMPMLGLSSKELHRGQEAESCASATAVSLCTHFLLHFHKQQEKCSFQMEESCAEARLGRETGREGGVWVQHGTTAEEQGAGRSYSTAGTAVSCVVPAGAQVKFPLTADAFLMPSSSHYHRKLSLKMRVEASSGSYLVQTLHLAEAGLFWPVD